MPTQQFSYKPPKAYKFTKLSKREIEARRDKGEFIYALNAISKKHKVKEEKYNEFESETNARDLAHSYPKSYIAHYFQFHGIESEHFYYYETRNQTTIDLHFYVAR